MSSSCAQSDLVKQARRVAHLGHPSGPPRDRYWGRTVYADAPLGPGTSRRGARVACSTRLRCHRLHCYITGPLFLLGAFATVLSGLEVLHIEASSILAVVVTGTAAAYGLEHVRGRYVDGTTTVGRSAP